MRRPRHPDVVVVVAAVAAAGHLVSRCGPNTRRWSPSPRIGRDPAACPAADQTPHRPGDQRFLHLRSGLPETSYACRAVTEMGWLCQLAAEPGTGYISGGDANRFPLDQGRGQSSSFGERVTALSRYYSPIS